MKYVLGIDIGTSGTKTVLFDECGSVIASSTAEYPLYQPQNGWAEQNPEDWWNAVKTTVGTVIGDSGISNRDIAGIGMSGQMHGLVMLDENNNVLRPSIIWCDQRTAEECAEIERLVGRQTLVEITANPALTGFTASKIMWVKRHEPEIYAKCRHILLPKDYIRFMLTGEYATEMSDASGMQLINVAERRWSDRICELLGIDISYLGKLYESPEITGAVTSAAAKVTGLLEGTPVVGGAGDNAAAAVGTGTVTDGSSFTTVGTSGVVYTHTDSITIDMKGRVHTFCCAVPGAWHVMGVTQAAGLSLRWLRDTVCTSESQAALDEKTDPYVIMDRLASAVPVGADRLIYLPYLMGERTPHLDANARGVFFGLSAVHTRAEMIRSVMEGVGFSLQDCREVFSEMGLKQGSMCICGGGAKSKLWRSIIADIYGAPVSRIASDEGPALGAAILAMVGTGIYPSVEKACAEIVHTADSVVPDTENTGKYREIYKLYRRLYTHLKDDYALLAGIR